MNCKKIILIDDSEISNCIVTKDVSTELFNLSEDFVKVTTDKLEMYINLNYVISIIPSTLQTISS